MLIGQQIASRLEYWEFQHVCLEECVDEGQIFRAVRSELGDREIVRLQEVRIGWVR